MPTPTTLPDRLRAAERTLRPQKDISACRLLLQAADCIEQLERGLLSTARDSAIRIEALEGQVQALESQISTASAIIYEVSGRPCRCRTHSGACSGLGSFCR